METTGLDAPTEVKAQFRFGDKTYTLSGLACANHSSLLKFLIYESKHDELAVEGVRQVPLPAAVLSLRREAFEYIVGVIERMPYKDPFPGPYQSPLAKSGLPETFLNAELATEQDRAEVRRLAELFDTDTRLVYDINMVTSALDMKGLFNASCAVIGAAVQAAKVADLERALEPSTRKEYLAEIRRKSANAGTAEPMKE